MLRITAAVGVAITATLSPAHEPAPINETLERVADLQQIVTGVAVTPDGRVIVNTPRWFAQYRAGVYELSPSGGMSPYPDRKANSWAPRSSPLTQLWVCVQSVHTDAAGTLWVLDPAAPGMLGPDAGAPKLVRIDPQTDQRAEMFNFKHDVAPEGTYLNDVRVDPTRHAAFITDSGLGAIVVLDLTTGRARRVLADHPSTKADPGFAPVVGGRELRSGGDGPPPQVNADGIAIDPDNGFLYWQALTNKRLYRAPLDLLTEGVIGESFDETRLAAAVEDLGETVMTDGMAFDRAGNIYFTALEHDAIMYRTPEGEMKTLVHDPRISWPDSIQIRYDDDNADQAAGWLYFTTARIHETEWFNDNEDMPEAQDNAAPYGVWRVRLPE